MKVFEFDFGGVKDWVCAEDKDAAIKWYRENIDDDMECDIFEVRLYKSMWYGVDSKDLQAVLLKINRKAVMIKIDPWCDHDYALYLTFKEVIEIDKPTSPYVIASTEY